MGNLEESSKPLRELTPKQEAFCQAIFNGMTQVDAYKKAYDAENMKPNTIYRRAYELVNHGAVSARIEQLYDDLQERTLWNKEEAANVLKNVIYRVVEDEKGNIFPASQDKDIVAAVKELNAMHGINAPSKSEITIDDKATMLKNLAESLPK